MLDPVCRYADLLATCYTRAELRDWRPLFPARRQRASAVHVNAGACSMKATLLASPRFSLWISGSLVGVLGLIASAGVGAQSTTSGEVTFTKDIAPILQKHCQACHRPDSLAPMSLLTYEDARPYARAIKARTALRTQRGTMPPWYIEKDIGIQQYKDDPSLSEEEIAKIAKWADSGAPRGNPTDLPPALDFGNGDQWKLGKP